MRRSLLAVLRGPDGRSLAWALAILVALNAFVAGGHIGYAGEGPAVCTVASHSPTGDGSPTPAQGDPCCFAGCISTATGLAGGEVVALPFPPEALTAFPPAAPAVATDVPHIAGHGPRGPPTLA